VLRRLLQLGLLLECRNVDGRTPLLAACSKGECARAEVLLAAGADIHATGNRGWGVLHCCTTSRVPQELIRLLLDQGNASGRPLNIEAPIGDGSTPLMCAAKWVQLELVEALLAAGADVAAADKQGCTALHVAGDYLNEDYFEDVVLIYKLLVGTGSDLFALDNDNQTPLQLALEQHAENPGVVQFMKEQVAQVPKLRADLASISSNLQTIIVGAAAEMRRLDRARAEQQQQLEQQLKLEQQQWQQVRQRQVAELELQRQQLQQRELEWARREEALAQRAAECEKRERELSQRRRLD